MEIISKTYLSLSVTDPSHKKAQLTDISSVITSNGELTKVCSAPISEQTAINESSLLLEFKDLFTEKVDPLKILLERFDSKTFGSKDIDEQKVVRYGKKTFDMILSEYLGTSDKITGKSSNPVYNESNVQDLMQDYAHTHKKEYTSYDRIADKIKKYLG